MSSFLGRVAICGVWMNMLLGKFWMHLSINFGVYVFFDKIFFSLSTSGWNFKKLEDKSKQRSNVCTKPSLYSSWRKLMKLGYTPLNVHFLKTLITNFCFFSKYFNIKKGKWLVYFSLNWQLHVLMFFINIFKKKLHIFWFVKQNKNIVPISFVIN